MMVDIPAFGDEKGQISPESMTDNEKVLAGIPVGNATVAEPLEQDDAIAAMDALTTPAAIAGEDDYPGDFTATDRAMLAFMYNEVVPLIPALNRIVEFANSLTPEVQEHVQKTVGNPIVQRLLKNLLPGA